MIIPLPIKKYIVKTYLNNTSVSVPMFINQVMQYLDDNFLPDEIVLVKDTFGVVKLQIGKFCYLVYMFEESSLDNSKNAKTKSSVKAKSVKCDLNYKTNSDDQTHSYACNSAELEHKKFLKEVKVHKNDMQREIKITKNLINAYFTNITVDSPFGKIIQPKLVNDIKKQEEEYKKSIFSDLLGKKTTKKIKNETLKEIEKEKKQIERTKKKHSIESYLSEIKRKEIDNEEVKTKNYLDKYNLPDELEGHKTMKVKINGLGMVKGEKTNHNGKKIQLEKINEKYNILFFDVFLFASTFSKFLELEMCDFLEFANEIVKFKKSTIIVNLFCSFIKVIAFEKRKCNSIEDFIHKIKDAIKNVEECYTETDKNNHVMNTKSNNTYEIDSNNNKSTINSNNLTENFEKQNNIDDHSNKGLEDTNKYKSFWSINTPSKENYESYTINFLNDCIFMYKIKELKRFVALFEDTSLNENSKIQTLLILLRFLIKIVEQTNSFRIFIDELVDTIKVKEKLKYDLSVRLRPRKKENTNDDFDRNKIVNELSEIGLFLIRNRFRAYFGHFNKALYYFVNDSVYFTYNNDLYRLEPDMYDNILKKGKLYNSRDTYLFVTTLRMIKNALQNK